MLARTVSDPLVSLAAAYLTASDNFMAEMVFQTFGSGFWGAPASIEGSQAAMEKFLAPVTACQGFHQENGSGLTWNNEFSPHCFAQLIANVFDLNSGAYTDLINGLPIGGKTGTLINRFQNPPPGFVASLVHAKTGTLDSREIVSALIGVQTIASGETVVFALMENDSRGGNLPILTQLRNWEDANVELLQSLAL